MAENDKKTKVLMRESGATTVRIKVPLCDIGLDPERFCHRDPENLTEEKLQSLMNSRATEGPQNDIEVYRAPDGQMVATKGHRRLLADRFLARNQVAGFTEDMEIEVVEVQNATPLELMIRSLADNEVRESLTRVERIRAVKKLHDNGASTDRGAMTMGESTTNYLRDLLIAQNAWMFQHVVDESIEPTNAHTLLEVAKKENRLVEVREDFDAWVAEKKRIIRDKERKYKATHNKEMPAADKKVKKYATNALIKHWVEGIKAKRRFDEDTQWNFAAGIDDNAMLSIGSVKLDLEKATLDQLTKVGAKLSQVAKQLGPVIKKRHEEERKAGDAADDTPYDLEYLRDLGLEDEAAKLELQCRERPDGEPDPTQVEAEERVEEDLASTVELAPTSEGETVEQSGVDNPMEPANEPPPPTSSPKSDKESKAKRKG